MQIALRSIQKGIEFSKVQLSLFAWPNFACCVHANLISDLNFVRAAGKGVESDSNSRHTASIWDM